MRSWKFYLRAFLAGYAGNYYCAHNFAQLGVDRKYYIEECIMNANKVLDEVFITIKGECENEN